MRVMIVSGLQRPSLPLESFHNSCVSTLDETSLNVCCVRSIYEATGDSIWESEKAFTSWPIAFEAAFPCRTEIFDHANYIVYQRKLDAPYRMITMLRCKFAAFHRRCRWYIDVTKKSPQKTLHNQLRKDPQPDDRIPHPLKSQVRNPLSTVHYT